MAALAIASAARGAEADALGDVVGSFDGERRNRGVPSISAALVEGGRVSLAQRELRSAARGEQLVVHPLGMTNSAFWQPPAEAQTAQLAIAHDRNGREVAGNWHVYPELAAAGLWSTPADLAQIIVAMAGAAKGDKSTLLGARGLDELMTDVDNLGYGLGVALAATGRDRVAMKRGSNLGFRSGLIACPGSGQGAVVMTNGEGGAQIVDTVLDALARRYKWPARAPWPE